MFKTNYIILSNYTNILYECCTEYRLWRWLENINLIQPLKMYNINKELSIVHHLGESNYDILNKKAVFMPIAFQFRKIFEKDDKLQKTLLRQNELLANSSGIISNFIQGKLWKAKIKNFQNKIVIPYFLYIDGFEINNSLGSPSTTQSVTAIYLSFPTSYFHLNLNEIFLIGFINYNDLKNYGNNTCLSYVINELKD